MLKAISLIELFLGNSDFDGYQADLMLRSAVERQLQIVTEAAIRLGSDGERLCPGHNWRAIRDTGNYLRHQYHGIDDRLIWETVKTDLPKLKLSITDALAKLPPDTSASN